MLIRSREAHSLALGANLRLLHSWTWQLSGCHTSHRCLAFFSYAPQFLSMPWSDFSAEMPELFESIPVALIESIYRILQTHLESICAWLSQMGHSNKVPWTGDRDGQGDNVDDPRGWSRWGSCSSCFQWLSVDIGSIHFNTGSRLTMGRVPASSSSCRIFDLNSPPPESCNRNSTHL